MKGPRKKQSEWKKVMRTAAFSIYHSRLQARRYRINWSDPAGARRRYKMWADSVEEAAGKASEIIAGRDPDPVAAKPPAPAGQVGLLVIEAFEEAKAQTRRGARSRLDWKTNQDRFIAWLAEHHPDCTRWSMLTRQMLREYIAQSLPAGASANYVRLTVNPVVQTAGFMERDYNLPNVAKRLGIGSQLKKTPPLVPLADVAALLAHLRGIDPMLEVGAALQGLAGLQLMEALRLTWDKVDLDHGLIEISGEVKNGYRNRVIPVCALLHEILHRADRRRRLEKVQVIGESQPVVASPTGCSFARETSFRNYYNRLKPAIGKWNPKVDWAPKDLRNCLPTFAVIEGLHSDLWEQYIGHAPRTVTGRHYVPRLAAATPGERELLERKMDLFRKLVVEPIDRQLAEMARKGHDTDAKKETADFSGPRKPIEISG